MSRMKLPQSADTQHAIAPEKASWDVFFDAPGFDLGARDQPPVEERNELGTAFDRAPGDAP